MRPIAVLESDGVAYLGLRSGKDGQTEARAGFRLDTDGRSAGEGGGEGGR